MKEFFMKGNIKMINLMEKENIFGRRILIIMMVSGNLEYLKAMESRCPRVLSIREIGRMDCLMDMEFLLFKTKVVMTEIGKMDSQTVKVLK